MPLAKLTAASGLVIGFALFSIAGISVVGDGQAYAGTQAPTLVGTPNPVSVTLGSTATTLEDSVVLSGGGNPAGTITFTLHDPNTNLLDTETATVAGDGTYVTPTGYTLPTTGVAIGTYQWDVAFTGGSFNVSDSNDPAEQVMVSSATEGLVTLSGVVTDATGAPESGTVVTFNGESDVTGDDGTPGFYLLNVPPGTSGLLAFNNEGDGPPPFSSLLTKGASITVGSNDVVENFQWPAATGVVVTVTDASSNAVAGVSVSIPGATSVPDTLSDGTGLEVQAQTGGGYTYCTTDGAGQCTLEGMAGSAPYISTSYQPPPGGSAYPTYSAAEQATLTPDPETGVANVTLQFVNMSIQESDGTVIGALYVASPSGTTITDVSITPIPDNTLPSGAISLTGALSYDVTGLVPGSTIDVTFQLPPGTDPTGIYKIQNGSYVDLTSIATISGDLVSLQLTDGGIGDADGVANGTIVDPLVFAQNTTPSAPTIGQVVTNAAAASAEVAFTAPTMDGGPTILGFFANYTSTAESFTFFFVGSASPLEVTGLTVGDIYTCSVAASNDVGLGASSDTSSPLTWLIPQTIDFTPNAFATVGTEATLTATGGSSGNSVVFTIDPTSGVGVCKVSGKNGTTINYYAVGNCVIDANQAGNATYAVAATVTGATKVGKVQTIGFAPLANKTMAQSPLSVSAAASSGLTVTFTSATTAVCSAGGNNGSKITLLKAGKCTVVASQAGNATYNPATSISQSFTVSMAVQTINFGGIANKTLAQSPVSVGATSSSGLTVTFTTSTPAVCTATGTDGATIALLKAGKCTVVASQTGSATYYPATPVSQNFTVSKASQTINFGELANRKLTQSPIIVSATSSSGLAVTFTTTTPAVCTSAGTNGDSITLLKAGTCTVVANQLGSATYNPASPASRSFTVAK